MSIALGLLMVLGVYPMFKNGYTRAEAVAYAALFRIGWSLVLSWVVFACTKGYGWHINSFLSWGAFTVLGRLTFFSYLIHLEIINIVGTSMSYSIEMNIFQLVSVSQNNILIVFLKSESSFSPFLKVFWYIGVVVIVMSTAFVASLCFEMPFGGIEKIVLTKLLGPKDKKITETKPHQEDETDETNASEKSIDTGGRDQPFTSPLAHTYAYIENQNVHSSTKL